MIDTEFEARLRDGLARAADAAPAAPALDARVATRARQRARMATARRAGAGLLAIALLAGVVVLRRDDGAAVVAVPAAAAPAAGTEGWWTMSDAPIGPRFQHLAVWTGEEVVVWGGIDADGRYLHDGAAWDPATDTWRTLAPSPLEGRNDGVAVWTGAEVVVVVGDDGPTAAAYDPVGDGWRLLADPPLPGVASALSEAVWTGDEVLVVGGTGQPSGPDPGAWAYDPATDTWRSGRSAPGELPAFGDAAWTGTELLLVGDVGGSGRTLPRTVGWGYDPAADRWRALPEPPLGGGRTRAAVAWTGRELVVAGGWSHADDRPARDGAAYDPATDRWRALPDAPIGFAGSDRYRELWTGTEVLALNERDGRPVAYRPATGTWRVGDRAAVTGRDEVPAAWTGTAAVVWGGGAWTPAGPGASSCCALIDGGEAYQPPR